MALILCFYCFDIIIPFLRLMVVMVVVRFLEGAVMLNFLLCRVISFLRNFWLFLTKLWKKTDQ